jgi:PAS domain S-box-containing protein
MTDFGNVLLTSEQKDAFSQLILQDEQQFGVVFYDEELRITGWNSGAHFITGWAASEVIGQPTSMLFIPEDRQKRLDVHEANLARIVGSPRMSGGTYGGTLRATGRAALVSHLGEQTGNRTDL